MDNNFSEQVKTIIATGKDQAHLVGNSIFGTEHLLLGIIKTDNNKALDTLKAMGVDVDFLYTEIEVLLKNPIELTRFENPLKLNSEAESAIRITVLQARSFKSKLVESEHLLLSILRNQKSQTSKILDKQGINYDTFYFKLTGKHKQKKATFFNWILVFIGSIFEAMTGTRPHN